MSLSLYCRFVPVLLVVCQLLCIRVTLAQQSTQEPPVIKFGKITADQFGTPLLDSTIEAVVLYDYGEVNFEASSNELWLVANYHIRTQILKKSAYGRATIQIPIQRGKTGQHESVSNFDGYTYNLNDGKVSTDRITKSSHFTERVSESYWVEKYTLPTVREGSIIEYQYTVRTPFNIRHNPGTWRFQQDVPVNWSEYRITIPDNFYYNMIMGGYLSMTLNEHKPTNVALFAGQTADGAVAYRFAVKNAPAFRDEAYITTEGDYLSKIDFELASYQLPNQIVHNLSVGWSAMDKTLLDEDEFGGQIKRGGFLRETARELLNRHKDSLARITAAYDFIRHTIKWNEESALWSNSIKKVFDAKKGDAADINLMLIALLREMDIDANPVILSTRSHGHITEAYALLKKFNYVIAHVSVGGKDLLLDATDPYLLPGMLPLHCLNGTGRLVLPTNSRFISLQPAERDIEVQTGTLTLDEEGEVAGKISHSHGGYSAWSARKLLAMEGKTKYLDNIRKKRVAWQIEKADFSGEDLKSSAFNIDYTLTIPEACSRAGDRLYFRPMLTEAHTDNPFKESERLYPVDFGVQIDETFIANYTLPKGFVVEEMPKPAIVTLPENGGRFIYQVSAPNAGQLQVTSRIQLRRTTYFAEEYSALREFFSRIVAKHAEQVVLKRGVVTENK